MNRAERRRRAKQVKHTGHAPGLEGALREAIGRHQVGDIRGAEQLYRRILGREPDNADAHHLLGMTDLQLGDIDRAERRIRHAIELAPEHANYWSNLGIVLKRQGAAADALAATRKAITLEPERNSFWINFAEGLRQLSFSGFDRDAATDVVRCLSRDGIDHQSLAPAGLDLVRASPSFRALEEWARANGALEVAIRAREALPNLGDPLLIALMNRVILQDPVVETALTAVRRVLLDLACEHALAGVFPESRRAFVYALSRQCYVNEYVFACSHAEGERVDQLVAASSAPAVLDDEDRLGLAVIASYRPLSELDNADALDAMGHADRDAAFRALIEVQIGEALVERGLATGIDSLAPIRDDTSRRVRAQYEESPYPRWTSVHENQPRPVAAVMKQIFPHLAAGTMASPQQPDILVAGCGTGKHAISSARRFASARVLAVDLSHASLAYARRKADELGADSVELLHADILDLDQLGRDFDIVECAGVLHHMADPLEGWRVLVGCLRAEGLMKIGLYSETARQTPVAAQQWVAAAGYPATPDGIRRARAEILALPEDHPVRAVARRPDFYSTSACRDLIFHVHERRFTLPEIATALEQLGLEFIGFELSDTQVYTRYRDRFPDDPRATSLAHWHEYEESYPETFAGMYTFWARRAKAS